MKPVMVIGGGLGILGRAVASLANAGGWQAVLIDRAEAIPDGIQPNDVIGGVDTSDASACCAAIERVVDRHGRIDALVNTAGGFRWETFADGDAGTWLQMHAINVATTLNLIRAVLPHLRTAQGSIVNIGAEAALRSAAGMGAYGAAKAAVHRMTESLAEEMKADGVRVNAVLPRIIDTPTNRRDMPDADPADWVTPEQVASAILFLASAAASGVTGALLPVVGGVKNKAMPPEETGPKKWFQFPSEFPPRPLAG